MKKRVLFFVFFESLFTVSFSQTTSILSANSLVLYGVDCSDARIILRPKDSYYNASNIIKSDFPLLNAEAIKLTTSFVKNFYTKTFLVDTVFISEQTKTINPDSLIVKEEYVFNGGIKDVEAMVKNYKPNLYEEGIGLVYVVESFDEVNNWVRLYITFFDIKTKKVLVIDKAQLEVVNARDGEGWHVWKNAILKMCRQMRYAYEYWIKYPR